MGLGRCLIVFIVQRHVECCQNHVWGTFLTGHFEGEAALGFGSNLEKRKAAAKTSLPFTRAIKAKLDCVCSGGHLFRVAEHIRALAQTEGAVVQRWSSVQGGRAHSVDDYRWRLEQLMETPTLEMSRNALVATAATTEAEQIQTDLRMQIGSLPMSDRIVSIDNLLYSQQSCGVTFRDGSPLRQLVEELHSGLHDPLTSSFLQLEVIHRDGKLFSNDNRRLYCLKRYRDEIRQPVQVRFVQKHVYIYT